MPPGSFKASEFGYKPLVGEWNGAKRFVSSKYFNLTNLIFFNNVQNTHFCFAVNGERERDREGGERVRERQRKRERERGREREGEREREREREREKEREREGERERIEKERRWDVALTAHNWQKLWFSRKLNVFLPQNLGVGQWLSRYFFKGNSYEYA